RQILSAHAHGLRHLHHHDRHAAVAAAGPLFARDVAVKTMALATDTRPLAAEVTGFLTRRARWSPLEIAFWLVALVSIWLFPAKHLILTAIWIWAMFALSLDLILGYAGVISRGHAAFFGLGAYSAGLIGKYGFIPEPTFALVASGLIAAAVGFATSFLVLRGSDLTRLMVTFG